VHLKIENFVATKKEDFMNKFVGFVLLACVAMFMPMAVQACAPGTENYPYCTHAHVVADAPLLHFEGEGLTFEQIIAAGGVLDLSWYIPGLGEVMPTNAQRHYIVKAKVDEITRAIWRCCVGAGVRRLTSSVCLMPTGGGRCLGHITHVHEFCMSCTRTLFSGEVRDNLSCGATW